MAGSAALVAVLGACSGGQPDGSTRTIVAATQDSSDGAAVSAPTATDPTAGGGSSNHDASTNASAAGDGSEASGDGSASGGEPPLEGSGPESPLPSRRSGPVLSLPSIPTGGSANGDTQDLPDQCVQAAWLSQTRPPQGIRVEVAGIGFRPKGTFVIGGTACAKFSPRCLGAGFAFTHDLVSAGRGQCYIPVHATGSGESGTGVDVTVSGTVACPVAQEAACRQFADEVGHSSPQVSINIPFPSESTTESPPTDQPPSVSPSGSVPSAPSSSGESSSGESSSAPSSTAESSSAPSSAESSSGGSSSPAPADSTSAESTVLQTAGN